MPPFAKYRSLMAAGGGFLGGFGIGSLVPDNLRVLVGAGERQSESAPSWQWERNWDKLEPAAQAPSAESGAAKGDRKKARAVNHVILVRHGQYNTRGKSDADKSLTDLGRLQAEVTGMRLAELDLPYTSIVKSTMTRAQQTSALIEAQLPGVPVSSDPLLVEGFPVAPDPPLGHVNKPDRVAHQDGPRIEAAFRKYVHRAEPHEHEDRYSVLVCHANVIRYFVCRALQFPPQAWLRLSLNHASITWISVTPSGRVILRCYGETGHMLPQWISSK
ncbi:serine/threonine-protein phosphatase PGAM5, mitochondrial-like [Phymastichus coffea]|uniref:serine/threonine-protein phosphatase PGAM5, mitochondrial-like n=1 Tax=Phymastichus coffea TaxID=108790 RepID=UPI00273C2DEB|nr:serine/threonine-protein phosphatase PGAM5, mitochondrial-like [Phymastichus coffea]